MAKPKLRDTDADALLRAFYREESMDERAISRSMPRAEGTARPSSSPAVDRSPARRARRAELLAACALLALAASPAFFDAARAPLASKATEALRQGALRPLLAGLGAGAERVLRSYSENYASDLMSAP